MRKIDLTNLHTDFFSDFGFSFDTKNELFKKDFDGGCQIIFIHYSSYPDAIILEYNLGIRIHEVEKLIHNFLPTLYGYSDRSVTLVQTLDKIGRELPSKFVLEHEGQIPKTVMSVEKFFVSQGFHWLDKMSDPVNLEIAFAERKAKSFKTQNFIYNAFRGTALSKLYRPEDYQALRENYLKKVKQNSVTPFNIAAYLRFLNFLDHQPA